MSDFERMNSERGGSKIPTNNRKGIGEYLNSKYESAAREDASNLAHYQAYGNGQYVQIGTIDRLLGKSSARLSALTREGDQLSYKGGYYDKGTRNLSLLYCGGIIPDFINKQELLNIIGINPDVEITDKNRQDIINAMLVKVGYQDAQDENIVYEELPEVLRNNVYYSQGYALVKTSSKGRR